MPDTYALFLLPLVYVVMLLVALAFAVGDRRYLSAVLICVSALGAAAGVWMVLSSVLPEDPVADYQVPGRFMAAVGIAASFVSSVYVFIRHGEPREPEGADA